MLKKPNNLTVNGIPLIDLLRILASLP